MHTLNDTILQIQELLEEVIAFNEILKVIDIPRDKNRFSILIYF